MTFATPKQIGMIHGLAKRMGLDDAAYREALSAEGVASSKKLTVAQAGALIERWNAGAPARRASSGRSPRTTASGRFAPILRALWIAGYNLGVVREPDDTALIAFVQRQRKVDHTRFLTERTDALAVVEALKKWLARDAGVIWPKGPDPDGLARKRAVLEAQWRALIAAGAVQLWGDPAWHSGLTDYVGKVVYGNPARLGTLDDPRLTGADLDKAGMALGRWLRRAQAERKGAAA